MRYELTPHCCVRDVRRAGNVAYVYGQTGVICAMQISVDNCVFLEETFRKLAGTGDQRFVIGDAIGGCGGLRVASTL
jgi:hypothetical protein